MKLKCMCDTENAKDGIEGVMSISMIVTSVMASGTLSLEWGSES